jgi:hypothetical protein
MAETVIPKRFHLKRPVLRCPGRRTEETHAYGALDVAIKYDFRAGIKFYETYFAKGRLVSRRTDEKARSGYMDTAV